jgi:hypothetical protein
MPGVAVRFRALTTKALRIEFAPVENSVKAYLTNYLRQVQAQVQPYPAVPPNSKYKRTYSLYRGWHITGVNSFDQSLVASSRAGGASREYAEFVHGDRLGQNQRWYHAANNWKLLADYYDRRDFREGIQSLYARLRVA